MKKVRVILDLRGLVIRCFYAGQEGTVLNAAGKPVPSAAGGVKRFIDMYLEYILQRHAPINVIAVLEGGNQRRRALFTEYKARPAQDAEDEVLTAQREETLVQVQRLLMGLGCLLVKANTVEADDMIAYLCKNLDGGKVVYTVDGDLMQLHGPQTSVIYKDFGSVYKGMDLEVVNPKMVALYKSIVGDSSDGYSGVKGLGEKAWEHFVDTYGWDGMEQLLDCVENSDYQPVLDSLKDTPDSKLQKLYDSRDEWRRSWMLAKLHPEWCETSFGGKLTRPVWAKRVPTVERVQAVLAPLGLESYVPRFKKHCITKTGLDRNTLARVDRNAMLRQMRASEIVAFDYESFDKLKHPAYQEARQGYVDVLSQEITGCSFAFGSNLQHCVYVSADHRDTANVDREEILKILESLDTVVPLVAQNAPFEMTVTAQNFGKELKADVWDTKIMARYVDEEQGNGLKELSKAFLNYKQANYSEVVPEGKDMRDVSLSEVLDYGCDDSIVTAHLYVLFRVTMECEGTWEFYKENEPAFDQVMCKSFITGIPVDYERLEELKQEDLALKAQSESLLRGLLEEHCSEVNEAGFQTLWAELQPYHEKLLLEKGCEASEVAERLQELEVETREKCKYVPLTAPALLWNKVVHLSSVAKALELPGIRSLKFVNIAIYANGILDQAETQGVALTEKQKTFLQLILGAPDLLSLPFFGLAEDHPLIRFCTGVVEETQKMWEGDELNIDSPKQMAELFYGKMGLPVILRNLDKTDSNKRTVWDLEQAPSTNVNALETWLAEINNEDDWRYKVLKYILTLRGISTRFKLYYNPYPLFKSPVDGRIHPSINNCGTVTKRPSGSSPNILQVSKKDEGKMRSCVLPLAEDEVVVSIDFVQQELVILAGESDDANLRSCYQGENRRDVHSLTGTAILNIARNRKGSRSISYEEFVQMIQDKEKEAVATRKKPAKITNFLTVYGGSAGGLARKATVPLELAQQFLDAFFGTYPGVKRYQEKQIAFARRHGYVKTCFGTRRHLNSILSSNKAVAAAAERQSGNFPIQGGAADVLKKVMKAVVVGRILERTGATVYAPVYDEIVASVPIANVVQYCRSMEEVMEIQLPGLGIGLETSVSIGPNWGDQTELGTHPTEEKINEYLETLT